MGENNSEIIEKVREIVKNKLAGNSQHSVSHRWDHIVRVQNRALELAAEEEKEVDYEVLRLSVFLHDIIETAENKKYHVENSLQKAKEILRAVDYPDKKIEKVLGAISTHSSEDQKLPDSIEGKILFDSDKLDGLGAIGIARVFSLFGQRGKIPKQGVKWYKKKIKKTFPLMQTKIGKRRALQELHYVQRFLEKFKEEERKFER